MANTDLRSLFHTNRLPSGVPLLLCLLYTPLGLGLLVVRLFISVQALLAFTVFHSDGVLRSVVMRVMSAVLGVFVRVEPGCTPDGQPRLLLANHVSCLDPLALQLAAPCDSACSAGTWPVVRHALRCRVVASPEAVERCVTEEGRALLLQPEGANTSGRAGLLTFSAQCVPRSLEVQPVALRAQRPPLTDVSISTLASSTFSDLLYFLFVPGTLFTVSFLKPMKMQETETTAEFLERIRLAIALHLKITPTKFSSGDKAELVKRETFRAVPRRSRPPGPSPELQRMATQVKEVLPRVPLTTIVDDLKRTRSVDQTIANLLEGVVRYVPEPPPPTAPAVPPSAAPPPAAAPIGPGGTDLRTGADEFARTSAGRQLSFEERKRRLFENARRRYIEQHGLKVPGYNC
ncbi:lipid droplet-regulating VLDL assembly factor AUP1-like [Pollicipes pollicipes]|uniref:lipid droplet-regulating VLDL assembly factor AUP1-like n=1 Tax=Pollicipes pollicipes TaxID=41117 RepID=UPI001885740E|nr:lipid droplet-regulating VLDL assembly factor AUP1-like [Pollicipes pollicipes]XP_037092683.1 lipid droplet-regulating VLDL assembly factor AUP1-like [Pollicipes pollicipes]XP_037092684.1 lipid droplet-regulating VLDL assembly factor AUP1-like [Pollicipes pollicipes]